MFSNVLIWKIVRREFRKLARVGDTQYNKYTTYTDDDHFLSELQNGNN